MSGRGTHVRDGYPMPDKGGLRRGNAAFRQALGRGDATKIGEGRWELRGFGDLSPGVAESRYTERAVRRAFNRYCKAHNCGFGNCKIKIGFCTGYDAREPRIRPGTLEDGSLAEALVGLGYLDG